MTRRPTGIIRTLPSSGTNENKIDRSIRLMEDGRDVSIYFSLTGKPRFDVLHFYLVVGGQVKARFNIAGYSDELTLDCWDGKTRTAKCWAICTGPVSRPPEPIKMKGFQGFRYTEELW